MPRPDAEGDPPRRVCKTCLWWDFFGSRMDPLDEAEPDDDGYCRANPPSAVEPKTGRGRFPLTLATDWCREHHILDPIEPDDDEE